MPIRKKKISDLTLADSLKGLYTIGYKVVGGVKTSVKVGLEYIQVAYEDVVKATQDAISAAKTALTAASTADTSREAIEANELERESNESARKTSEQERAAAENQRATAETGRDNAEKARVTEFSKIKTDAEKATGDAISATGKTNEAIQNANVATNAANAATAAANQAAIEANKSAENAEGKAQAAQNAANNANDTAEHPTYIGQDHYVYKWNKTTSSYDKTDIYTKGDAFSIKKVYASVAELEADANNTGIAEGDFVLVNTGDVENPDNAKLYVKAKSDAGVYSYEFLVDMSGAIGFTGKTPQFTVGNVSKGSEPAVSLSEDGIDGNGNPKFKFNLMLPKGDKGDAGEQGPKGEKGDTGLQGEQGIQGNKGNDGTPCTHSWNGSVLTVTSASGTSSADLKGPKGDTGLQGLKGDTGATGPKGDKGDPGVTGPRGEQGPKGDTGLQGATGATGPKGDKGDPGDSKLTFVKLDVNKNANGSIGPVTVNFSGYKILAAHVSMHEPSSNRVKSANIINANGFGFFGVANILTEGAIYINNVQHYVQFIFSQSVTTHINHMQCLVLLD